MMEEAEAGIYRSNKTVAPGAVSTKSLGTWEKHTKGTNLYMYIAAVYIMISMYTDTFNMWIE